MMFAGTIVIASGNIMSPTGREGGGEKLTLAIDSFLLMKLTRAIETQM